MVQIKDIFDFYRGYEYFDGYGNKREDFFLKHLLLKFCKDLHSSQGLTGTFEDYWLYDHSSSLSERKGWKNNNRFIESRIDTPALPLGFRQKKDLIKKLIIIKLV